MKLGRIILKVAEFFGIGALLVSTILLIGIEVGKHGERDTKYQALYNKAQEEIGKNKEEIATLKVGKTVIAKPIYMSGRVYKGGNLRLNNDTAIEIKYEDLFDNPNKIYNGKDGKLEVIVTKVDDTAFWDGRRAYLEFTATYTPNVGDK